MAFVHSVGNGPSLNSLLKYLTRNGTRVFCSFQNLTNNAIRPGSLSVLYMSYSCFDFFCCDICIEDFIKNIMSLHYLAAAEHHSILSKMVTPVCTTDVICENFPMTVLPYFFPEGLGIIYSAK